MEDRLSDERFDQCARPRSSWTFGAVMFTVLSYVAVTTVSRLSGDNPALQMYQMVCSQGHTSPWPTTSEDLRALSHVSDTLRYSQVRRMCRSSTVGILIPFGQKGGRNRRKPNSNGDKRRRSEWGRDESGNDKFPNRKRGGGGDENFLGMENSGARMQGLLDELFNEIESGENEKSVGDDISNGDPEGEEDEQEELEDDDDQEPLQSEEYLRATGGPGGRDWAEAWAAEMAALDQRGREAVEEVASVAGTPQVVEKLRSYSDILSVPLVAAAFPFELDDYQLQSVRTILRNESLVLSAPTGAGKTVAGEAAVYAALALNRRVFYTTPLKALSNQKFLDLSESLGPERVGLSTGDVRQNVDAEVVVMTTEVYRNMLYSRDNRNNPGGKGGSQLADADDASTTNRTADSGDPVSEDAVRTGDKGAVAGSVELVEATDNNTSGGDAGRLETVSSVVLDEFHYMNDADRGTVWEESVINSPPWISLVALSATMANAMDVRQWIYQVHGPCELVISNKRPVPLRFSYCDRWGILPLMQGPKELRGRNFFRQEPVQSEIQESKGEGLSGRGFSRRIVKKKAAELKLNQEILAREARKKREYLRNARGVDEAGALRKFKRAQTPPMGLVIRELRKYKLLPGIVFIFSRKGCEEAALDVVSHVDSLTSEAEKDEIARKLDIFENRNPGIVNPERKYMVVEGVATHHAGLLPVWKAFIEELFQEGLLKVVFATETLAAGINMPARTTVISALARRRGEGVTMLTSSEFRQMAGRAGRRGKDSVGFTVVLKSRFRGAQEAHIIVRKKPEALKSKFTPTFGMVLNLLSKHSIDEAQTIVAKSFGSYLRARRQDRRTEKLKLQVERANEIVQGVDPEEFRAYNKLRHRLKAEKRTLRYLIEQSRGAVQESVLEMLQWAPVGTPVLIPCADDFGRIPKLKRPGQEGEGEKDTVMDESRKDAVFRGWGGVPLTPAIILDDGGRTLPPYLVCLGRDNKYYIIPDTEVTAIDFEQPVDMVNSEAEDLLEGLKRPPWFAYGDDPPMYVEQSNDPKTAAWALRIPDVELPPPPPEVVAQEARVQKIEDEIFSSPVHNRKNKRATMRALKFLRKVKEEEEKEMEAKLEDAPLQITGDLSKGWERSGFLWGQFLNLTQVLGRYGFVEGTKVTSDLGRLGAEVKGDNELWVALVLLELDNLFWDKGLSPHQLAAVIGALVSYEPPPGTGEFPESLSNSEATDDILDHLRMEVQGPLAMVQQEYFISVPINLEPYYVGLVEAWALGEDWMNLVEMSGMQEGDLCNLLRRTLDVLRLIPRLPTLSKAFKRQARSAIKMVGRYPITDTVTYEIQATELADEEEQIIKADDNEGDLETEQTEDMMATPAERSNNSTSQSGKSPAVRPPRVSLGLTDDTDFAEDYDEEERILEMAALRARNALENDGYSSEFDKASARGQKSLYSMKDDEEVDEFDDDFEDDEEEDGDDIFFDISEDNEEEDGEDLQKKFFASRPRESKSWETTGAQDVVKDLLDALYDDNDSGDMGSKDGMKRRRRNPTDDW